MSKICRLGKGLVHLADSENQYQTAENVKFDLRLTSPIMKDISSFVPPPPPFPPPPLAHTHTKMKEPNLGFCCRFKSFTSLQSRIRVHIVGSFRNYSTSRQCSIKQVKHTLLHHLLIKNFFITVVKDNEPCPVKMGLFVLTG